MTVIAYLFEGESLFEAEEGEVIVPAVHTVTFGDGDHFRAEATEDSHARFMVMAGAPIKEPIFAYGPFVMNTGEEIIQAFEDLRNGTFVQA